MNTATFKLEYFKIPLSDRNNGIRRSVIGSWLKYASITGKHYSCEDAGLWFFTFVELVYPGVITLITKTNASPFVNPNIVAFETIDRAVEVMTGVTGRSAANADEIKFPRLCFTPDHENVYGSLDINQIYCVVGICLWCIGKRPTNTNQLAFTERHYDETKSKYNGEILPIGFRPTAKFLLALHVYFDTNPALRIPVVGYFRTWLRTEDCDPTHIAAATVFRFWENAGMMHLTLINNLLNSYIEYLVAIPGLRAEIRNWHVEAQRFMKIDVADRKLWKVIHGDWNLYFPSKQYPELLKLAKSVFGFVNYAPQIPDSRYLETLVSLLKRKTGSGVISQRITIDASECPVEIVGKALGPCIFFSF